MTIGIVGLGYVGLPLAVAFAEAGQRVVGVDTNAGRVNQLRAGESYIEDIPSERLQAVASRIEATTRTQRLGLCDAIIIAVPTPLTANREPELGPLIGASQTVADALQPGQLVVLESTTYPGTTRERVLPILEETGLVAGRDFHLAFSPERVDPGNETYSLAQHAEDPRRPHPGLPRPRRGRLRPRLRADRPGLEPSRSPRWRSCWRTSSARSTSRSSTSWRAWPTG